MFRRVISHSISNGLVRKSPRSASTTLTVYILLVITAGSVRSGFVASSRAAVEPQRAEDVALLELAKPIEREVTGGQSHSYKITPSAGHRSAPEKGRCTSHTSQQRQPL